MKYKQMWAEIKHKEMKHSDAGSYFGIGNMCKSSCTGSHKLKIFSIFCVPHCKIGLWMTAQRHKTQVSS